MSQTQRSPSEVVCDLIRAIESQDIEEATSFMSDQISYENMPMEPVVGKANVAKVLSGFLQPAERVEWRIVSELAKEDTVYNERLDRFCVNGSWLELPIAGVFRVKNSKIELWRDYFDMATYTKQLRTILEKKAN